MIDFLLESARAAVADNQFFAGGLLLMIMGLAANMLRAVPRHIWELALRQMTLEVEVRNSVVIGWVDIYLREHEYGARCRRLKAQVEYRGDVRDLMLVPGMGVHWIRLEGRWFRVKRELEEGGKQDGSSAPSLANAFRRETLSIRTWGRRPDVAHRFLIKARKAALRRDREAESFEVNLHRWGNDWCNYSVGKLRPLSSVVLAAGSMESIISDLTGFLGEARRDFYLRRGIPYRRGYLVHGPPGSGKSSLVKALCCEMFLKLFILDLSADITDGDVARLLAAMPERSAVLIEDVDCLNLRRTAPAEGEGVTLSGVLNALDGVIAAEGRVLFMTSNRPDELDDALVRDGRVDMRLELDWAVPEQAARLFSRFFEHDGGSSAFGQALGRLEADVSMATLQNILIRNCEDPKGAVAELESNGQPHG